jgi:hypothetical protein
MNKKVFNKVVIDLGIDKVKRKKDEEKVKNQRK